MKTTHCHTPDRLLFAAHSTPVNKPWRPRPLMTLAAGCALVLAMVPAPVGHAAEAPKSEEERIAERLEWFQDLKLGFFVHFGIYSQWGCVESWPLVPADKWARPDDLKAWTGRDEDMERFQRDYRAPNKTFNPVNFDPKAWAAAAKDAGMKYFVFTTKHHDGFNMYDTALPEKLPLVTLQPRPGSSIQLLGHQGDIPWRMGDGKITLDVPADVVENFRDKYAYVFRIEMAE